MNEKFHQPVEGIVRLKRYNHPERRILSGIITAEDIRKKFRLPKHAEITIRVPGGGDWSGLDAVLGTDIPHIHVKVKDIV